MNKIFYSFLIILVWGSTCCLSEETAYKNEARPSGEIHNLHIISSNIMRGGQPSEEAFILLQDNYGVKTILSLRDDLEHNQWERSIVERLGMVFINIPMNGAKEQNRETIEQCLKIINDKSKQPTFVHCRSGKNRTGLILAAYRIKYDDWGFDEALTEMLAYGYDRAGYPNLEKSLVKWSTWRENYSKQQNNLNNILDIALNQRQ